MAEEQLAIALHKSKMESYQLELNRHDSEIDNLNQRPDHVVCFESGNIHVSQLVRDSSSSATLCDCHDSEKSGNT